MFDCLCGGGTGPRGQHAFHTAGKRMTHGHSPLSCRMQENVTLSAPVRTGDVNHCLLFSSAVIALADANSVVQLALRENRSLVCCDGATHDFDVLKYVYTYPNKVKVGLMAWTCPRHPFDEPCMKTDVPFLGPSKQSVKHFKL